MPFDMIQPSPLDMDEGYENESEECGPLPSLEVRQRHGLTTYYISNLLATGAISAIAVVSWSTSMGIGQWTFQMIEDLAWMQYASSLIFILLMVLLYLLDFFYPPHLPSQMLRLWEGDVVVGRGLLGMAGVFLSVDVLLLTPGYPGIPVITTTLFCPLAVAAVHAILRPGTALPKGELLREIVEQGDVPAKLNLLREMLGSEKDQLAFYKGATGAFLSNFGLVLPIWIVFGVVFDIGKEGVQDASASECEKIYIQWATPLLVAISNLVFAMFGLLRVFMQNTYSATDVYRNRLIADTIQLSLHDELLEYELATYQERRGRFRQGRDDPEALKERYLTRHVQHIKQLSMLVKVVGCTFVLVIGALYVVGQLLYANSDIAFMVLALLGAFFLLFIVFVSVAFSRILWAMGQWLQDLPAWKALSTVASWSSIRAFFLVCLLPAIPVVLLLSFLTQRVRQCRGLDQASQSQHVPSMEESLGLEAASGEGQGKKDSRLGARLFTRRVAASLQVACQWDVLAVTWWCYVFCGLWACYNVFPLLLNVGLSWLRSVTQTWPFGIILGATFLIGVVAFLLPPVPGMTVYIFGGLVISGTCPWGFWWGAVVNVGMCWFLKLVACAIQQKVIGGLLGRSLWVRRTARVHQVGIRCIEAELRVKGWTAGKVAILCGGPDWPTSVYAGVLGLSVWECELGTIPIIGFVLPCALTGSLYIKKDEGQIWSSAANLMIVAAVVVNLLLWAVAFWAIQNRLEADYEELKKRLPENVDLHWLDYREEQLSIRAAVSWSDTPICVRSIYLFGAIVQILVCNALTLGYSYLFGSFAVQDDINALVVLPTAGEENELLTWGAVAALGVYFASFICFFQYALWRRAKTAEPRRRANKELASLELEWKGAFLTELAEEEAARQLAKECRTSGPAPEKVSLQLNGPEPTYITVVPQDSSSQSLDSQAWAERTRRCQQ